MGKNKGDTSDLLFKEIKGEKPNTLITI